MVMVIAIAVPSGRAAMQAARLAPAAPGSTADDAGVPGTSERTATTSGQSESSTEPHG